MTGFDLKKFLKNYKPKILNLAPYLKLDKLNGYRLMKKNDVHRFILKETYIKYINVQDAFMNKDLNSHVHPGGILLFCGRFLNGKFEKIDNISGDRSKITHLMLKSVPLSKLNAKLKNIMIMMSIFFI